MIYNINYNENFIEILIAKATDALIILPGKHLTEIFKKRDIDAISYDDLWFKILPLRASHIAESVIIDRVIKGNYTIKNQLRQAINEFFYYGLNIKDLVCLNAQHDLLKETIIELYKLLNEHNISLRASTLHSILNTQLNLNLQKKVYVVLPVIFSPLLFEILQLFREKFNFNLVIYGYDKSIDYEISYDHPQYFIQEFLRRIQVDHNTIIDLSCDIKKIHSDDINIGLSQLTYPAKLLYRLHYEKLYQFNHIEQFTTESIAEEFKAILGIIVKSDARNISIVSKDCTKLKLLYNYLKEKIRYLTGDYKITSSAPTYCYDYQELRLFFRVLDLIGTYEITLTEIFDLLKQSKYDQDMICLAEKTLLEIEGLDDKDIQYTLKILEKNQLVDAMNLLKQVLHFINISNINSDLELPIELSDTQFDKLLRAHIIAYIKITGYTLNDTLIELLTELQKHMTNWVISLKEYKSMMLEVGMRTIISSNQFYEKNNIDSPINIDLLTSVERRFLSYDLTIICDLKEGIWPPSTEDHFFIAEYTRRIFNYTRPAEYEIGYAAYDFISIIASSKKIIISNLNTTEILSKDATYKSSIDSRFLLMLDIYSKISNNNYNTYYVDDLRNDQVMLNTQAIMYIPVEHRSKLLSSTSIEKLIYNPYLYSLEYNLHLKYLPKCFNKKLQLPSNKEFGIILHNILHNISQKLTYKEDYNEFFLIFQSTANCLILEKYGYKADYIMTFWQVKFDNIIQFIYNYNQKLYIKYDYNINTETEKSIAIDIKVGQLNVKLQTRADRLDWTKDLLYISDYKTGQLPSKKDIDTGNKIQLNLEALIIILLSNDFDLINGDIETLKIHNITLRYIRLTGIDSEIKDIPFNLANTINLIRVILQQLYIDAKPYIGTDKYNIYLQGHIMRVFDIIEHKS